MTDKSGETMVRVPTDVLTKAKRILVKRHPKLIDKKLPWKFVATAVLQDYVGESIA